MENTLESCLQQGGFRWWSPPSGRILAVGPKQRPVSLPNVPLPLNSGGDETVDPTADQIGRGIYDYLRQFPDCTDNKVFAQLLRDAFPHFLGDLASHILLLDEKEVDAPYVKRKIVGLKILALVEPTNPRLLQLLGESYYGLGLMFAELAQCRQHFLAAMGYLQRSLQQVPHNPTVLNLLAQIDFWFGDYPAALRRLAGAAAMLGEGTVKQAILNRISLLETAEPADHPLIDDLEALGYCLVQIGEGDFVGATMTLERLEEENIVPVELPNPEFFYLLGICREQCGDLAGAFEAFEKALVLDPEYLPAQEGTARIQDGEAHR